MIPADASRERPFRRAWIAAIAVWGGYFSFLWPRMLFERSDGLYAGWRTLWADWAVHFAYANVFAYRRVADWFATNPIFAAGRFDYPFLADGLSGLLMRVGFDRIDAFVAPSILASLILVALLFVFYEQMLRSPGLAWLAMFLFFTNGGMGFVDFGRQLVDGPILEALRVPPREYTYFPDRHIWWINIVSSELLPQRAFLLGIPLGLAALIPLRRRAESGLAGIGRGRICALAAIPPLLVVTHMHTFLALVVLCAVLFAHDLRSWRPWIGFAVAAGLPSAILFGLLYAGSGAGGFISWYPGWLTHPAQNRDVSLWLFLWLNWGPFLPIAIVSFFRFRYARDPLVVGGAILFALCFLLRFQPNLWDNTKLLTWSHLLLCVPVARYLGHLWCKRSVISRCTAALLLIATTASGSLELWRMTRTDAVSHRMWSRAEMDLARELQAISRPTSIVLCSDHHHHWVPSLSGRQILLGYRGWLGSYGVDYGPVVRDIHEMLGGGADAERLLATYGVEFVAIGPSERRDFGADESYFERNHERVLERADYKVYRVRRSEESDRP